MIAPACAGDRPARAPLARHAAFPWPQNTYGWTSGSMQTHLMHGMSTDAPAGPTCKVEY